MYTKYPRTAHLPSSEGVTSDDKILKDISCLLGRSVVITEKRDGENTTGYYDHIHARSIDSKDHESRHWLKAFWSTIQPNLPVDMRVCGENLFAQHSVPYTDLTTYFEVFSIWMSETDICLSWNDTKEWCQMLGLTHVPVLYEGIYHEGIEYQLPYEFWQRVEKGQAEGYVVRVSDSFHMSDFSSSVVKWVRKNHVQTSTHWMHQQITPNKLK